MIAIVGARNASAGGRQIARTFARELGEAGYIIVSGLALGVDACAHEASLATGTVAVLAGGIARIYPERHQPLSDDIRANGLLVTEMPPHHAPRNRDFPRRNRIISGCALGTVVIEAAQRSGSLITARFALEQNREVFAVPGSPLDPRAQGTNRLIRDGATLVARTSHILDMLAPLLAEDGENHAGPEARDAGSAGSAPGESFSPETGSPETGSRGTESPETGSPEDESARTAQRSVETPEPDLKARVVALLSPTPVGIDALIRETGTSASKVQGALLELELAGVAARHTGNRFTRVPD